MKNIKNVTINERVVFENIDDINLLLVNYELKHYLLDVEFYEEWKHQIELDTIDFVTNRDELCFDDDYVQHFFETLLENDDIEFSICKEKYDELLEIDQDEYIEQFID